VTTILRYILSPLINNYRKFKYGQFSTFTYFIPSPSHRNSAYQEKQFDKITNKLGEKGFKILDIKTQSVTGQSSSGTLVILMLRANSKEASQTSITNIIEDFDGELKGTNNESPEGLYYID
jgi:hypothetical protein